MPPSKISYFFPFFWSQCKNGCHHAGNAIKKKHFSWGASRYLPDYFKEKNAIINKKNIKMVKNRVGYATYCQLLIILFEKSSDPSVTFLYGRVRKWSPTKSAKSSDWTVFWFPLKREDLTVPRRLPLPPKNPNKMGFKTKDPLYSTGHAMAKFDS